MKNQSFVWTLRFLLRKSHMLPKKGVKEHVWFPSIPTSIHPTHYDNEVGDYGNDIPLRKNTNLTLPMILARSIIATPAAVAATLIRIQPFRCWTAASHLRSL